MIFFHFQPRTFRCLAPNLTGVARYAMAPAWRRGQGCHECNVNGAAAKKELCHSFLIASKTCSTPQRLVISSVFTAELKRIKRCWKYDQDHPKKSIRSAKILGHFINPKSQWGRAAYLSSESKTWVIRDSGSRGFPGLGFHEILVV